MFRLSISMEWLFISVVLLVCLFLMLAFNGIAGTLPLNLYKYPWSNLIKYLDASTKIKKYIQMEGYVQFNWTLLQISKCSQETRSAYDTNEIVKK